MKIKPEDYATLKESIESIIVNMGKEGIARHMAQLKIDPRVKDIDTRFRWDLFYAAKIPGYRTSVEWTCEVLYKYMNDDHIDTALKSIIREIQA